MSDIKFLQINEEKDFDKPTYNDIDFSANNDIATVIGSEYLAQTIAKILKTDRTTGVPYPSYSTSISQIRTSNKDNSVIQSLISEEVVGALAYLKQLEESPIASEQIAGIESITLESVETNNIGNMLKVKLRVVARDGSVVKATN